MDVTKVIKVLREEIILHSNNEQEFKLSENYLCIKEHVSTINSEFHAKKIENMSTNLNLPEVIKDITEEIMPIKKRPRARKKGTKTKTAIYRERKREQQNIKSKLSANTVEKCNTETRWQKKYKEEMFHRQNKTTYSKHTYSSNIVNKQRKQVVKININQF